MADLTLESLRCALLTSRGPAPLLTFYDTATGERVELSNASVDNWVAKTANLMTDLGVGRGDHVAVDLPDHWQTAVWLLAAWAMGATCVASADAPTLTVTTVDRAATANADDVVVCSLRPMGLPSAEPLPTGVIDYAVDVRSHGDHFTGPPPTAADETEPAITHAIAVDAARSYAQQHGVATGARLLIVSAPEKPSLATALAVTLAVGGSLVIVSGDVDDEALTRIESAERTDARIGG